MIENTTYFAETTFRNEHSGDPYATIILTHNCSPGLYCEPAPRTIGPTTSGTCRMTKEIGQTCHLDIECKLVSWLLPN